MNKSKEKYRVLCEQNDSIPLFSRSWWLDAACGDDWVVLLNEKNGRVCAAMPLYVPCKYTVTMPHYTQTMGIWFAPEADDAKYSSRLADRQAICRYFIEKLMPYQSFLQNFNHSFTDWLPFHWAGYEQTTRYTYILHNIKDFDRILSEMSQQTRRNLKKAEKLNIRVQQDVPIDDFLKIQAQTFERQNIKNKFSNAILKRLIVTARERKQGNIFGGYDENGQLHAVAFVVWQNSCAYYVAGGGNTMLRSSGAHSLVMWEAIKFTAQFTDSFDFEGSMLQGVERFFREFGTVQTPYFTIKKGQLSLLKRVCIKMKIRRFL